MSSPLTGFAVCPSGLEEALVDELQQQPGFRDVRKGRGGAGFVADATSIARANIWARLPTRILIQAASSSIRKPDDIRAIATKVLWEKWFTVRQTVRIDLAVGREPKLDAPLARNYATLLIKDGICDRFRTVRGERPSIDTAHPDIRIWAYLDQNQLTLYLDTSGEPLFKRGWRQAKGDAPLRENLAAALIAMTQWDRQAAVMDPFCGSGTLLIEAMQSALRLPPGYVPSAPRSFAAEQFHASSPMGQVNWQALRNEARQAIDQVVQSVEKNRMHPGAGRHLPRLYGSDNDARMIAVAQRNAERALPAAVSAAITWQVSSASACTPITDHGLIMTNPPYGKRLAPSGMSSSTATHAPASPSTDDMDDNPRGHPEFERSLAETLKKRFAGWQAWILSDNLKLETGMRLKAARRIPVFNGDIECRWFRFDMVTGSMRDKP